MSEPQHARDIDDAAFLRTVAHFQTSKGYWANRMAVAEALQAPEKVALAKARRLIRRGLLDGCDCGCRGDFELTDAGRKFLADPCVTRAAEVLDR